jgi:hypothetical protein
MRLRQAWGVALMLANVVDALDLEIAVVGGGIAGDDCWLGALKKL